MGRLKREDMVKNYVSQTRTIRYYIVWGIVQKTRQYKPPQVTPDTRGE